jgi:integrase/recombinase XerD
MGLKKGRKPPKILTDQERTALLSVNPGRRTAGRNNLMVKVLLNSGLRSAELLDLRIADIDWKTGAMTVHGKGNKYRIVWLPKPVLQDLRRYKNGQGPDDYVFATKKGGRIQARYLRALVKRLAAKAGIERRVHPHMMRHTFATGFYKETKDLMLTRDALGHASVETTEIYTHLDRDDLRRAMQNYGRKNDAKRAKN